MCDGAADETRASECGKAAPIDETYYREPGKKYTDIVKQQPGRARQNSCSRAVRIFSQTFSGGPCTVSQVLS